MLPDPSEKPLYRFGLPRCNHANAQIVITTTAAGARAAREQCLTCGKLDTSPHKLADHPDAPPVAQGFADSWAAIRKEAGAAAQALAQKRFAIRTAAKPSVDADWWREYDEFLHSDAWVATRQLVFQRDGGRCTVVLPGCTRKAEQVHHVNSAAYRYHNRLGATPLFLLASTCVHCHEILTEADRADRSAK